MIKPKCVRCGKELKEFGAILLSPPRLPQYDYEQTVGKYHICRTCFHSIFNDLYMCMKKRNEMW